MACFSAALAESLVIKALEKHEEKKEAAAEQEGKEITTKVPMSRKLKWLCNMLWGGSALLAFEHVWHGEIVPWFPFLTAMYDPADTAEMLGEIVTVGGSMCVLLTAVWFVMCKVSDAVVSRPAAVAERTKA